MTLDSLILNLMPATVPLAYVMAALAARSGTAAIAKRQLRFAVAAFVGAMLTLIVGVWPAKVSLGWFSFAPVSLTIVLLVSFIGLVIAAYSRSYMAGEQRENRYYQYLHLTLAAVSVTVISNHLIVLLIAWVLISLSLHQLLMFYPGRRRAALAAHKKFLFARMAEVSLLAAILLLYAEHGTWRIDQIVSAYPVEALSSSEQMAAVMLAITALIKCAQLPLHGWLIQVVEAPTPVSALLHAGIINLGGYLLILFGPLLAQAAVAQWLVLVVAGLTVLLAGLTVMTRVSIKVKLAWSTSAQMGLMLVECALGLYELALLHLVAHSCYKAYGFLNAGSNVENYVSRQLAPAALPGPGPWLLALALSILLVAGPVAYLSDGGPYSPWLLLVLCLTVLFAERSGTLHNWSLTQVATVGVLLVAAYAVQKTGAHWLTPSLAHGLDVYGDLWVCLLFLALGGGYLIMRYAPSSRFGRNLWLSLYAGLYLDEWATRVTLAVWPHRLPVRNSDVQSIHASVNRDFV